MLTGTLALAAALAGVLALSSGAPAIIGSSFALGIAMGPWFPLVLSAMISEGSSAGETGTIIAVSGLGAAALPLAVGAVSRGTGSLRVALMVPLAGLILLLVMSFRRARAGGLSTAGGV
jgi:fucose permease